MFKRRFLSTIVASAVLVLAFASLAMAADTKKPTSGSIDLTNTQVTPLTSVSVGGGTWDYGTSLYGLTQKKVWSNYWHPTSYHHSSCTIGANFSSSGITAPGLTSFSSAVGGWFDSTNAYWGLD